MARTGKKPVTIVSGVKIKQDGTLLYVEGSKGNLKLNIPESISLNITASEITVEGDENNVKVREKKGTVRQLLNNMVNGVSAGFERKLLLVGVGYRALVEGKKLVLFLGYSHNIEYKLPDIVTAKVDNNTKIVLNSCDKQVLGQTAAEIRSFRPPEPYKGKGVRYEDEVIRRKAGKTGKK